MKSKIKFGTGGFRGVIGESFNKENIQLVAQAIANLIHSENSTKPVVVGFDYRFLSDKAAEWISEVFAGNNIKTLLSKEATPTPAVMYLTKKMQNDFGIMITASHNPYYFNGIKVFQKEGMDADVELTSKIEELINEVTQVKSRMINVAIKENIVQVTSFLDKYVASIRKWISPQVYGSNIRVLFDNLHGVGTKSLSLLAKELGLKNFKTIEKKQDAFFNKKLPNPTKENMELDRKYLKNNQYDCVLGIDSDGDRLGVLDELGNYVSSNEILASLYYYLVKYRGLKGDSVKNCATSNLLDKVTEKMGYKCHEVDVGFKNISSKIKSVDALLGGESSGGLTVRGYLYGKDSSFAAALFLEMITVMNKPVSKIIQEVKDFAGYSHFNIEASIDYHEEVKVIRFLENETVNFPEPVLKKVQSERNIKYYFDNDSWILIRRSGTEPVLRLFVEMDNEKKAKEYINILKEYVKGIDEQ